jgi:hypothetical protein
MFESSKNLDCHIFSAEWTVDHFDRSSMFDFWTFNKVILLLGKVRSQIWSQGSVQKMSTRLCPI